MKKISFLSLVLVFGLSACVSKKQYNDVLESQKKCCNDAQDAKRGLAESNVKIRELSSENDRLKNNVELLSADTLNYSNKIYELRNEITQLNDLNEELKQKLGNTKSEEEIKLLLADLQALKEKLQLKEDDLDAAEKYLQKSQLSLSEKQREIDEKSQKVKELSDILNRQDSLMRDLKNRVSQALIGLEGNGLTVTNKNGRVYVSLDEQLLFKSGKWDVDPKGVAALERLSKLLAENPDIQIVVEGHTDDVPFSGSGQVLDNWDLSVKRATAITRIILNNKKINPIRVTAAGRSEYLPLDPAKTADARQKNRRTEIILSPNLDELMQILSK